MTRSNARELAVHFVFEMSFTRQTAEELLGEALTRPIFERIGKEEPLYAEFPNVDQREYIETLVRGVEDHREELDGYISQYAIGWNFSRLPRVTVSILRVCMFEILYMGDVPNAAAINEAVELTKRYEQPEMAAFVNGILGSFVRSGPLPQTQVAAPAPETFSPEEGL
mgnify:FL=1